MMTTHSMTLRQPEARRARSAAAGPGGTVRPDVVAAAAGSRGADRW